MQGEVDVDATNVCGIARVAVENLPYEYYLAFGTTIVVVCNNLGNDIYNAVPLRICVYSNTYDTPLFLSQSLMFLTRQPGHSCQCR